MKAQDLKKKEMSVKDIYEKIETQNNYGCFKTFIPHDLYVSELTKLELIENGFKVYKGNWDGIMRDCLIIEW